MSCKLDKVRHAQANLEETYPSAADFVAEAVREVTLPPAEKKAIFARYANKNLEGQWSGERALNQEFNTAQTKMNSAPPPADEDASEGATEDAEEGATEDAEEGSNEVDGPDWHAWPGLACGQDEPRDTSLRNFPQCEVELGRCENGEDTTACKATSTYWLATNEYACDFRNNGPSGKRANGKGTTKPTGWHRRGVRVGGLYGELVGKHPVRRTSRTSPQRECPQGRKK